MSQTISHSSELKGVFPAIFTPLNNDDPLRLNNTIDYKKAEKIIDDLIASGVTGLVPVGTTGQSTTLSAQQHIDFIKFTIEYVNNRVPIIAGAGSNCTRESVETINKIQADAGKVSFLCVTGYYNNPPQEGLLKHFETVVSETGANLVLYNVPGRTNSYLQPQTLIELAKNEHIIGLKQAVDFKSPGAFREDTIKVIEETAALDFSVFTGEDDALVSVLELGGAGMITATGNIPEAAKIYVKIMTAFHAGNLGEARNLQASLSVFVNSCFLAKNPVPLATLFNSPVFQPLISIADMDNGELLHQQLMNLIDSHAPSLKQYF